ncbi:TPA: hypothetical protein ACXEW6_004878 [Enterobacter hormaechei]
MKKPEDMSLREIKREGKKILQRTREYQKQQGITGYRLMLKSEKKYVTFKGKPSLDTMTFSAEFNDAYVFSERFELLPYFMEIKGEVELLPITNSEF